MAQPLLDVGKTDAGQEFRPCPENPDTQEVRIAAFETVPFLKTYRTMCLAPKPEFRRVLEEIRELRLAA